MAEGRSYLTDMSDLGDASVGATYGLCKQRFYGESCESAKPSICTSCSPSASSDFCCFAAFALRCFSMTLSALLKIPPVFAPHTAHLGVLPKRLIAQVLQK